MKNYLLKSIDLSKNSQLSLLDIYNNKFTSIDLSKNLLLEYLLAHYSSFEELDLSNNINLKHLDAAQTNLKKLILPKTDSLISVDIFYNQIEELIYHKYPNMLAFRCHGNKIKSLNFEGWNSLYDVICFNNEIFGEEANILLNSLNDRKDTNTGILNFISTSASKKDYNWAYKEAIAAVKLKNWEVWDFPGKEYFGVDSSNIDYNNTLYNIYPNPSKDYLYIKDIENIDGEVEIYSSLGEKMKKLISADKVDIRSLPDGVYYIKINKQMIKFLKK